jgi:hypothetical protein
VIATAQTVATAPENRIGRKDGGISCKSMQRQRRLEPPGNKKGPHRLVTRLAAANSRWANPDPTERPDSSDQVHRGLSRRSHMSKKVPFARPGKARSLCGQVLQLNQPDAAASFDVSNRALRATGCTLVA